MKRAKGHGPLVVGVHIVGEPGLAGAGAIPVGRVQVGPAAGGAADGGVGGGVYGRVISALAQRQPPDRAYALRQREVHHLPDAGGVDVGVIVVADVDDQDG